MSVSSPSMIDFAYMHGMLEQYREKVLTNVDRSAIRVLICSTNAHIGECKSERDQLKTLILGIQNDLRLLNKFVGGYEALLVPIRRLPPEMLGIILGLACLDEGDGGNSLVQVMKLSTVCKSWRKLILTTPMFWSTIRMDCDAHMKEDVRITCQLQRSKTSPLTLFITGFFNVPHPDSIMCTDLLGYADQVHTIYAFGDAAWKYLRFCRDLPALRSLHLELPAGEPWMIIAPSLTHLSIPSSVSFLGPNIPWSNLRSLTARFNGDADLDLIKLCKRLEYLRITVEPGTEFLVDERIVTVSNQVIKRFVFVVSTSEGDGYGMTNLLIAKLSFPGLAHLTVTGSNDHGELDPWDLGYLKSFLGHSQCALVSLEIKSVHCDATELVSLLWNVPTLKVLGIHDPLVDNDNTEAFHPTVTQNLITSLCPYNSYPMVSPMLPKLSHLSLTIRGEFDPWAFVEVVESRLTDPSRNDGVAMISIVQLDIAIPSGWESWEAKEVVEDGGDWRLKTLKSLTEIGGLYMSVVYGGHKIDFSKVCA